VLVLWCEHGKKEKKRKEKKYNEKKDKGQNHWVEVKTTIQITYIEE
jgi:hypothetical protein